MSVLYVLSTSGSKQAKLKFFNYKFCILGLFVIYADFELIFEPLGREVILTTYTQQHNVFAAVAIFCSNLSRYYQLSVMKIRNIAQTKLLKVFFE